MFRKILVPYDSSKPADNAAKYATELAKSIITDDCEIILVNVVPNVPPTPLLLERPVETNEGKTILFSEYVKRLYEEMQINAREMLEKKKQELEKEIGVTTEAAGSSSRSTKAKVKIQVLTGDSISDKIIELAKMEKADLIVIGNVGLSGFSKLKTLGSVSRAISERSPCPVLIAH
jgi:nucleotide-binding universal stress UspA family protein